MAKVTSKYQVTLPKAIANKFQISPGDEIVWVAAGDIIRVIPPGKHLAAVDDRETKLRLFDQATERLRRNSKRRRNKRVRDRGWRREDLYTRGRAH